MMKPMCWVLLIALLVAQHGRAEEVALSPDQPYSAERSRPVTYDAELVVTVTAPYQSKLLRVWMPIPPSDVGQELLESEFSTFPETIVPTLHTESVYRNRFAYFEFAKPQGAQIIRHKFRIKVWELRWNLDAQQITKVSTWPEEFAPFLRSETQSIVIDDRLQNLFSQVVPEGSNPLTDLRAVMDWTHENFKYDHDKASLQGSSMNALAVQGGHCSDYHGFCAAMGRIMSLPTRITYGINAFPKSSPSHCKLEAFMPPYGWVSFDVSETQKLTKSIAAATDIPSPEKDELVSAAHRRLISGFRDNTWFLQTKGSDYELEPPASSRVPVVRTIYAEADGKPLRDPDPSSKKETTFAWMTAQRFQSDEKVSYPFTDVESLREWVRSDELNPAQKDN